MLTRRFVMTEDPDTGMWGWLPRWLPNANTTSGVGVAHDMLEHLPGDDGSVAAEMRAFGAMWHLRGETGYFYRKPSIHSARQQLYLGIADVLEEALWRDQTLDPPPLTHLIEDVEYDLQNIAENAVGAANKEFTARGEGGLYESETVDHILGWLRIGYRAARRRLRHLGNERDELFAAIEDRAEELRKQYDEVEGTELVVSASLVTGRTVFHIEEYY